MKDRLGFNMSGSKVRYGYTVSGASQTAFQGNAAATSNDVISANCGAIDTWTINQDKNLANSTNCAK